MSLAEASDARKARLLALRKRKAGEGEVESAVDSVITHRTYDPETRTLKKHATDGDVEMDTVEKNVDGLAEQIIKEDEERRIQELDLNNIAPKRPNWDLKRDLEKKISRLERKTQEAIHTLIRQRLAAQKGQSDDLAGALQAQADRREVENASDSDED
ncbi:mRNA splicing factor [Irpex rosettiformis]|uniref:mRNA splicing factor n=1 Tax=Irpex rosettiformis TaxID=378272 RepID=A0ACB8TVV7_9APHY|nr:mRNA splicing factor [Irpex rosettiformis]